MAEKLAFSPQKAANEMKITCQHIYFSPHSGYIPVMVALSNGSSLTAHFSKGDLNTFNEKECAEISNIKWFEFSFAELWKVEMSNCYEVFSSTTS